MPELQQPDIVGNFLSSYYTAQQKQQADEMARQAHALKIGQEVVDMLGSVGDGDVAGFERAKQRWAQMGLPPEAVAGFTAADLPMLRQKAGTQLRELQLKNAQLAPQLTQAQIAAANRSNRGGSGGSQVFNSAAQRAQLAQAYGIDPASAAGQKFVLTGQLPASLSPTDKKAILEADQMVMASQQGLGMLNQAKALNPKAAGGFGMGTLADIFAQIGDETALNTRDLENVLQSNVLPQLKVIFGGAPTEGERQILLDLQGSAKKTVEERRRIIDRSIAAANARIKFYQDQANDLRGGTYYSPTRGQPQPPAAPAASAPAPKKTFTSGGYTFEEVE